MDYKIKRLAGGGGFASATYYVDTMPTPATSTGVAAAGSAKEPASSLLDDDTFKELLTKGGLVNDVNDLVGELIKLETRNTNPFVSSNNRGTALKMIARVNELRENKNLWQDAMKVSKEAGGLGEVAVGASGEVYTKDKDNRVKAISLQDYSKNKDNVRLLSVAELLNERQYNPQLTGQNSIFNVANQAVGLDKITEHIKSVISAFGTEKTAESKYYSKDQLQAQVESLTGKKLSAEEATALGNLKEIVSTPGDLYKVKTENSSERRQAMKALDYIWKTLGTNVQQKLTATAVMNGEANPKSFILDMITNQTDVSSSTEISPEKLPGTTNADGSNADGTGKSKELTPFEVLHNGKTGARPVLWNDPVTGKKVTMQATGVAPVPADIKGKPIGPTTLQNIFKTESASLVDTGKAYFGDKKIGLNDLNNIIYDGTDSMRVYMPTNADGSPNYNLLKEFNQAQEFVSANKDAMTPEQVNEYYAKRGFDYVQVDNNYQIIDNNLVKPFWVMYGLTAEGAGVTNNNGQIKALSGDEKDANAGAMNEIWKKEKISAPTGWTDWSTTYYKGMIAIPYRKDSSIYAASIAGNMLAPQTGLAQARMKMETQSGRAVNGSSD